MTRYADYVQPDVDDRVIARATPADAGPCPDGCGSRIQNADAIAHDDDLGAWVHAEHAAPTRQVD